MKTGGTMTLRMTPKEVKQLKGIGKVPVRNKFNAKKKTIDGITFDSITEGDYYLWAKANPLVVHVDCHVQVTLAAGVRYRVDFIVWRKTHCKTHDAHDACAPAPEAVEVKGKETPDFRIKRRLFDGFHPMRPLRVVKRLGTGWVEV